ncbi:MAG: tRNA (N(6)-L-threonylcarbamoyladenosine(37)-C(2))-methylthiotransferase MtaB [Candidatus Omnitrophica bacterium]|nr:tRNA (N(6)-L-threonylcarbamoyladenosine(37)-C(2))-methylthiotransferase MtaB [Candidatus Omnitrophota bacterium]
MKVKFATLGCRLNQYETQAIREQFLGRGFEETQDSKEAGVFVLNTCTVTSESDRQSRYLIRKFHRENPEAKIVVTGCYVERNEREIRSMPGVTLAVLNREKSEIVDLFSAGAGVQPRPMCISGGLVRPSTRRYSPLFISRFEGRTRAYIKVQDGCNHACSFCKVVLVRGPARSRPLEEIVEEAKRLRDHGFQEVVLTGIQLGSYGYDFEKRQMLVDLLKALAVISGLKRVRLSSIEPTDVTDELIEAMASLDQVCPHLHIPLQSGDDRILERMNRRYRREFYVDLVRRIRQRVNDFVLTTDVMVGFPGEEDVHFDQTLELLMETKPYKLHIFPYSAREGTRAARFQEVVNEQEVRRRKQILFMLEEKLRRSVQERFMGRTMDVLVEDQHVPRGWVFGRTNNFVRVGVPSEIGCPGDFVKVEVNRVENGELVGDVIDH